MLNKRLGNEPEMDIKSALCATSSGMWVQLRGNEQIEKLKTKTFRNQTFLCRMLSHHFL